MYRSNGELDTGVPTAGQVAHLSSPSHITIISIYSSFLRGLRASQNDAPPVAEVLVGGRVDGLQVEAIS